MYYSKQVLFAFLAVLSVATATNQDRGGLGRRLKSTKTAAPTFSAAPSSKPSSEPTSKPSSTPSDVSGSVPSSTPSIAPSKAGKAGKSTRF